MMSGYARRIVAAVALGVGSLCGSAEATLTTGQIAPDVTLSNWKTKQPTHLRDFAGQVVVLDFFATWCSPCKAASSELERYVQEYYDARGGNAAGLPVKVVSMCIDGPDSDIAAYMQSYNVRLVLDDRSWLAFTNYPNSGVPSFAIINGADNANYKPWEIVYLQLGYGSGGYSTFRSKIDSVTRVPEPATLLALAAPLAAAWLRRRRGATN